MTVEQLQDLIASLKQIIVLKNEEQRIQNNNDKHKCDICGGYYTYKNKSKHSKTAKHKTAVEHMDTVRRIAKSKTLIARSGQY